MSYLVTSPHPQQVLDLFQKILTKDAKWKELQPEGPAFSRSRIYTLNLVIWLMIVQRLLPNLTLSRAVQYLAEGRTRNGLAEEKPISLRAGAYCKARQKLPIMVAVQVFELIVERLRSWLPSQAVVPNQAVFVLDGSTLSLPHSAALLRLIRRRTTSMTHLIGPSSVWWCCRTLRPDWRYARIGAL